MLFGALVCLLVVAWLLSPRDTLAQHAADAARAGGYSEVRFGEPRENARAKYVCGRVDGMPAVFREPGGLVVGSSEVLRLVVKGWCPKGSA